MYRDCVEIVVIPTLNEEVINLNKLETSFAILPNPSNEVVELVTDKGQFKRVTLSTIDGKQVFDEKVDPTNSFKIGVRHLEKGAYIIHLRTTSGQLLIEKLIKN